MSTSTLLEINEINESALGPLSAAQRSEIMRHATSLSAEARRIYRRLLIVGQGHGLDADFIARSAAQARAHFE